MKIPRATLDRATAAVSGSEDWSRLALWKRRAVKTIVAVVTLIVLSSVLHHYVAIAFKGRTPRYSHSLQ